MQGEEEDTPSRAPAKPTAETPAVELDMARMLPTLRPAPFARFWACVRALASKAVNEQAAGCADDWVPWIEKDSDSPLFCAANFGCRLLSVVIVSLTFAKGATN
jgi:hypothetical protein